MMWPQPPAFGNDLKYAKFLRRVVATQIQAGQSRERG